MPINYWNTLTNGQLLEYWLISQTTGHLGEFNKKYFPTDYELMIKDLEEIRDNIIDENEDYNAN